MKNEYAGMTVNERLYVSGLMGEFDEAVEKRDFERVCEILENVRLAEDSINTILEQIRCNLE